MQNLAQKIAAKVKCDVQNCKNLAEYYIPSKGIRGKFFLCPSCLAKLEQSSPQVVAPKSPKSKIKVKQQQNEGATITENM